jgi:LemA protein
MIGVYVVIGIVVVLLIIFAVLYNRLVSMHNQMKNLWAQVDVQLKRRHDLIPNLVETVKGYMQHERGTLEAVTKARNLAQSASGSGPAARAQAEGELTGALGRLLAVVENYPNLKANENFLSLQQQLTTTENNISTARQRYNDMVMMCNNLNQQFPSNIVARLFSFHDGEFFEVKPAEERAAPQVTLK